MRSNFMSADVSHVVGWGFAICAIIVFAIVLRDLLILHAERVAREQEFEKLRTEAHEAEYARSHETPSVSSMLD